MIAIRFIGLGTGERELYLLGRIGTALAVVLRFFKYRGIKSDCTHTHCLLTFLWKGYRCR